MGYYGNYKSVFHHCEPSMNERLTNGLDIFKGDTRKAMKLLSKQFKIESVEQEAPFEIKENQAVKDESFVITYFDLEKPEVKFKWKIKKEDLKY
jgi:hypothetical protein